MFNHSRKLLLINPRFQLAFVGAMLLLVGLVLALIYGSQWYFFWKFNQMGLSLQFPSDHIFFEFITKQKAMMNSIFLVLSLMIFLLLSTFGLFFSHKIAGPIYRLHQHLIKTSQSGEYLEIHFRKGDYFSEIADAYNSHLPKSEKKV